jgi:hypothetical protein
MKNKILALVISAFFLHYQDTFLRLCLNFSNHLKWLKN